MVKPFASQGRAPRRIVFGKGGVLREFYRELLGIIRILYESEGEKRSLWGKIIDLGELMAGLSKQSSSPYRNGGKQRIALEARHIELRLRA